MGERIDMGLSLSRIADVMNVTLKVQGKVVTGDASGMWDVGVDGMHLPVEISAQKLICGEQIGVLFHVSGDVWLLVAHNPAKSALSMFLVDAAKCELEGMRAPPDLFVSSSMTLREAVDSLHPAVVKAWVWKKDKKAWAEFKVPAPAVTV